MLLLLVLLLFNRVDSETDVGPLLLVSSLVIDRVGVAGALRALLFVSWMVRVVVVVVLSSREVVVVNEAKVGVLGN